MFLLSAIVLAEYDDGYHGHCRTNLIDNNHGADRYIDSSDETIWSFVHHETEGWQGNLSQIKNYRMKDRSDICYQTVRSNIHCHDSVCNYETTTTGCDEPYQDSWQRDIQEIEEMPLVGCLGVPRQNWDPTLKHTIYYPVDLFGDLAWVYNPDMHACANLESDDTYATVFNTIEHDFNKFWYRNDYITQFVDVPFFYSFLDDEAMHVMANWECSGSYNDDHTLNYRADVSEIQGVCPERQRLDAGFHMSIDVTRKIDKEGKAAADHLLSSPKDIEIEVSLESPYDEVASPFPLGEDAPHEEKYDCSLPESFEYKIVVGGQYYDRFGGINIFDVLAESEEFVDALIINSFHLFQEAGYRITDFFYLDPEEEIRPLIRHEGGFGQRDDLYLEHIIIFRFTLSESLSSDWNDRVLLEINHQVRGHTLKARGFDLKNQESNAENYRAMYPDKYDEDTDIIDLLPVKNKEPIVISEGPISREFYAGLIEKLSMQVAEEFKRNKEIQAFLDLPAETQHIEKSEVYLFPAVYRNDIYEKVRDFISVSRFCCARLENVQIPYTLMGKDECSKIEDKKSLNSKITISNDITVDEDSLGWWKKRYLKFTDTVLMDKDPDSKITLSLGLKDTRYKVEDKTDPFDMCGAPQQVELNLNIWGYHYFYDLAGTDKQFDIFTTTSSAVKQHLPSALLTLFEKKGYNADDLFFSEQEIQQLAGETVYYRDGDRTGEILDRSKRFEENIAMILSYHEGNIYLKIVDEIEVHPMTEFTLVSRTEPTVGIGIPYAHYQPDPLDGYDVVDYYVPKDRQPEPKEHTLEIQQEELAANLIYRALTDMFVDNFYRLKDAPELGAARIISNEEGNARIQTEVSYSMNQLEDHKSMQSCCKLQDEGKQSTGPESSVYTVRSNRDYSLDGIGYQILGNPPITGDTTKFFIGPQHESEVAVYRFFDEELELCSYEIIGQKEYGSDESILYSHDNNFQLYLHDEQDTHITINTVNISECNKLGISASDMVEVENEPETPEDYMDVEKIMAYSKAYVESFIHIDGLFEKVLEWV